MRIVKPALTALFIGTMSGPALAADAIPKEWSEGMAGPLFTVRAPAGTSFERVRTGDAFAGTFHGPGFELKVEFGYHREALKLPDGGKNAAENRLVVDEKPG